MARSINQVTLLGRLGKDAETKFTPSGQSVTNFSLACERSWKQNDEWKSETEWVNVVAWRQEKIANHLTKGRTVFVQGRLQTRSYEGKDGAKRYVTEVVADMVEIPNLAKEDAATETHDAPVRSMPRSTSKPISQSLGVDDSDIPW